jgi:hypothetical protein
VSQELWQLKHGDSSGTYKEGNVTVASLEANTKDVTVDTNLCVVMICIV